MKSFKVKYSKQAEKFLKKNRAVGLRFMKAFIEISEDPYEISNFDIKKYKSKNFNDIFRLRIGQYRAIFRIVDDEIIIKVFTIDKRGDVYKKKI